MDRISAFAEQTKKKYAGNLVRELLLLLFAGIFAGLLFFSILYGFTGAGLDYYFDHSPYLNSRETQTVQNLQSHITQYGLSPYDSHALSEWVKKKKVVYLEIYRDNRLLYASENWDDAMNYGTDTNASQDKYHSLFFADGEADVFLFGVFEYQFYAWAMVAEILLSCLVFLLVFITGIRNRIRYIQNLSIEISAMEGGCLDRSILIKGADELAELAGGLEQLRRSLKENIANETALRQANQKLTTGIAHDLRTPLTALTMYVQILQSDVCGEEEKQYYLDKIKSKASLMKDLSDRLFDSSQMTNEENERKLWEVRTVQETFLDLLSEMAMLLENMGFHIHADLEWKAAVIRVRMDYIARITDNIGSNLAKYADPEASISIRIIYEGSMAGIEISNQIKQHKTPAESNGVGMENIRRMISSMGGICQTETDHKSFKIRILFPTDERLP